MNINFWLLSFLVSLLISTEVVDNIDHPELGEVNWERDFEKGIQQSKTENKPIFLLFQEVPGCSTCQRYGQQVLSHPLIVDAIEEAFIPVAIFNNKRGKDAEVLKYYGEPAWNNPVVRIVDAKRSNLVDRVGRDYSQLGVVQAMVQALQATNQSIPTYLALLEQELLAEKTGIETAHFSMYCFWTGEKEIGQIDGVVETQPGFMGGREVVKVNYDPALVNYTDLLQASKSAGCASHVYVNNQQQKKSAEKIVGSSSISNEKSFRLDKDPKYYLSRTFYQYIPMIPLQAVKVNSAIGEGISPDRYLSPRQLELVNQFKKKLPKNLSSAINKDFRQAWAGLE